MSQTSGNTPKLFQDEAFKEAKTELRKKMKSILTDYGKLKEGTREPSMTPQFTERIDDYMPETSKADSASNSFLSETKNIMTYSDSSLIDTKERALMSIEEKIKSEIISEVFEAVSKKIECLEKTFDEKIELIRNSLKIQEEVLVEAKGSGKTQQEEQKKLMSTSQRHEKMLFEFSEKLILKDKEIEEMNLRVIKHEEVIQKYSEKQNQIDVKVPMSEENLEGNFEKLEKRMLENLEKLINEAKFDEKLKEIDLKFERNHYHLKSQLKNISGIFIRKNEMELINSQLLSISQQSKEYIEEITILTENLKIYSEKFEDLIKSQTDAHKILSVQEKTLKDLDSKYLLIDEKLSNSMRLKEIIKSRDEEVYKKFSDLECQILELQSQTKSVNLEKEFTRLNLKLSQVDSISHKLTILDTEITKLGTSVFHLSTKHRELEQDLSRLAKPEQDLSLDLSLNEVDAQLENPDPVQQINFDYSKTITSRLEKLEKLNIHKKAMEVHVQHEDQGFVPGEAESLVRSAILQKSSGYCRPSPASFGYRTLAPHSPVNAFSSFEEDIQPSLELRESLRTRGINFNKSRN